MEFEPRFAATAIGTLPFEDAGDACRLMLDMLPEMPAWPQLPARSFLENMYTQYTEGFPGIRVDRAGERVWFQVHEGLDAELEEFYQSVIDEDLEKFAISEEYASGLRLLTSGEFSAELSGRPFIKGQVTGPISFGLTVTDQDKRSSLYNETLEQVIVKGLTLKARWQSRKLEKAAPDARVVMFIDEPYLVSVGSALLSVSREQVTGHISECLRGCGADITGVHCCGNTDWSLIFNTDVDIVSFDAFECMEGFVAYDSEIDAHIRRGGSIAWGVVPNDEKVQGLTVEDLASVVEGAYDTLEGRGLDREMLARKSIVTPACGIRSASSEVAEAAMALTGELSGVLRGRYF